MMRYTDSLNLERVRFLVKEQSHKTTVHTENSKNQILSKSCLLRRKAKKVSKVDKKT